ncbi:uncharacterized protein Tco025E_04548 [Trypanosoma conorhini]|uniref:Uncharacterized protein n=1 Tax=Trypanosoma conorhini TaxID=83891 RepID=A0A422PKV4_9TRYP|nr:uncharacterized protein Tco025E_04548 [Trypanosoma conorhini]RNF18331.1 hypothetical protein Tco025E_04548 [Trypanosoma conorhini]
MRHLCSGPSEGGAHAAANGGGGGGVTSEELVALSTFHSLLLEGRGADAGAEQRAWLYVDVLLVECRGSGGDAQGGGTVSRDDIVRVLASDRLDLRRLPHLLVPSGNAEGADLRPPQETPTAGAAAPPLYGAANFTVMLSCASSLVVTVRLHAVVLAATPRLLHDGGASSSEEDAATVCGCPRFFCAADGHGEDAHTACTGILAAVGGKVYRLGRRVWEWDARELQRARSSCAVAFSLPRLRCFRWRAVRAGEGEVSRPPPLARQRGPCVGQTAWVHEDRYVMLHGGLCLPPSGATPRPPPKNKRRAGRRSRPRGGRVAGDAPPTPRTAALLHWEEEEDAALPCYDTKLHVWGALDTEGGDVGDTSTSRGAGLLRQQVFHSAVLMNDKVWCFGGCSLAAKRRGEGAEAVRTMLAEAASACQAPLFNALTCLDLPTRQWRTVEPVAPMESRAMCPDRTHAPFCAVSSPLVSASPPPLACHTAVGWNNQMFVFGGLREAKEGGATTLRPSNALYAFHVTRLSWWLLSPPPAAGGDASGDGSSRGGDDEGRCRNWPSARYGHAAAIVPEHPHGAFLVMGGATRLAASEERSEEAAWRCAWDELLWVYYAALGYWQRVDAPSSVPSTRRVFSSLQLLRVTGEPWVSYVAVLGGGCDAACLEQPQQAEEEKEANDANGGSDAACAIVARGAAAGHETVQRVLATALASPQCGTVWVSLEERGCWHAPSRSRNCEGGERPMRSD